MSSAETFTLYAKCWKTVQPQTTVFTICVQTDRQAWANSLDPDAASLGLPCLPLIQQFLDTTSGSELYWFKF